MFSHESEILRKMRMIEWLKAEMITSVGKLYHAMAQNAEQAIAESLAGIVICCYVLGKRLGIDFQLLDEAIFNKLSQNIKQEHEVEKLFGDLSDYQRHLKQKR